MTTKDALAIVRATTGKKYWLEGCAGKWYLTLDHDDNTSGTTYEKPEDMIRDLVGALGFLLFPEDWNALRQLRVLGEVRPVGFIWKLKIGDFDSLRKAGIDCVRFGADGQMAIDEYKTGAAVENN